MRLLRSLNGGIKFTRRMKYSSTMPTSPHNHNEVHQNGILGVYFMPWINNEYIYTKKLLKTIARNYRLIYEGLPLSWKAETYNPWSIAEYKADFDIALDSIGRGHWGGQLNGSTVDYRQFGYLQRVVIADILGIDDRKLSGLGFFQISQLRGRAYRWMANCLNGLPYGSQFIAKST